MLDLAERDGVTSLSWGHNMVASLPSAIREPDNSSRHPSNAWMGVSCAVLLATPGEVKLEE